MQDEDECYVCGDRAPKQPKTAVQHRPVSVWISLAFLASLAVTFYCYFMAHKLSLPVTLVISTALVLLRILFEWLPTKNSN